MPPRLAVTLLMGIANRLLLPLADLRNVEQTLGSDSESQDFHFAVFIQSAILYMVISVFRYTYTGYCCPQNAYGQYLIVMVARLPSRKRAQHTPVCSLLWQLTLILTLVWIR